MEDYRVADWKCQNLDNNEEQMRGKALAPALVALFSLGRILPTSVVKIRRVGDLAISIGTSGFAQKEVEVARTPRLFCSIGVRAHLPQ